jgi:[protein-PII] uridylyltransferase
LYALSISQDLLQELTHRMPAVPDASFLTEDATQRVLAILAGPCRVAETLSLMHRVRLLERLIPAFGPVRGLMQFNAYHKYTVDHHSLLAVGQAEKIGAGQDLLAQVYREIKRKDLLHLAILLHDVGKGQIEDHSLVGEGIARAAAERLGFGEHETRLLTFLVRYHLVMSNTAFRRDPSDAKVVLGFARQVGTVEALKMLYVLTAADISAVGPDVLTRWKETLLSELYLKTLQELSGEEESGSTNLAGLRADNAMAVRRQLAGQLPSEWISLQLDAWPERSLALMPAARIVAHLQWVWRLADAKVLVDTEYEAALRTTEYTVYTRDSLIPGIFSKIAGVLAAKGLQILDAQIATLADGIVIDSFRVADGDYPSSPPPHRLEDVGKEIVAVLEGRRAMESLAEDATRFGAGCQGVPLREPTVVQVDIETSDRYTIIDVFADDRQGLLYVITRAIFDLGLSVHAARISTKLDQIVDVFYVTNQAGDKVDDAGRCQIISETITARIEDYLGGVRMDRPILQRARLQ